MFSRLSNRSIIVLQLAVVVVVVALITIALYYMGLTKPTAGVRSVHFQVEATGGYSIITFEAGTTVISKPTTITTPWSKTLKLATGTEVYLTASNPTQTGKLSCVITLDSVPWKKESTDAPKDGVACAGIVP